MALPNIFTSAPFQMIQMTDAVNRMPIAPSRIRDLGLFEEQGITTTSIQIDSRDGVLGLVPDTPRSGPNNQLKKQNGVTRDFRTSHFPVETSILASEVQNLRDYGSADLATLESLRDMRLGEVIGSIDATIEYQRLGALKGVITDADGTTVRYNLFTEFGLSQTVRDFAFGTVGTVIGNRVRQVQRDIYEALGSGISARGVHVFCGKSWFEALIEHPNVKEKYLNWQASQQMTEQGFLKPFNYGGVTFEEYYGTVGSVQFVADNEAWAFPVGVPGLYKTYYAPGDFMSAVNKVGLPRYAASQLMDWDRGVKLMAESNPLSICRRPKALVKLTMS